MRINLPLSVRKFVCGIAACSFICPASAQQADAYIRYVPSLANSSGFRQAREFRLLTAIKTRVDETGSTGGWFSTPAFYEVQAAAGINFSPVKGLIVGLSYQTQGGGEAVALANKTRTNINYTQRPLWELQAGYYLPIGRRFQAEVIAGYARGRYVSGMSVTLVDSFIKLSNGYYSNALGSYSYQLRFDRYSLQTGLGFNNDHVYVCAGAKLVLQQFSDFQPEGYPALAYYRQREATIDSALDKPVMVAQPYLHIEAGQKYLKVFSQVGFAAGAHTSNVYVSMGLVLSFAPRYKAP